MCEECDELRKTIDSLKIQKNMLENSMYRRWKQRGQMKQLMVKCKSHLQGSGEIYAEITNMLYNLTDAELETE